MTRTFQGKIKKRLTSMSCLSLDHWNIRVWGPPVLLINLLQDGAGLIFFLNRDLQVHSHMLNRWPFTLRRSFEKQPFLPTINPNSILQLGFRDSKDFNRG